MTPRYWAFLSYSHADEAVAARLHRELERYTLPRRLRKAHALPARLTPIFRDVEELEAASGLNTRLQDALDESRWLIVLCSSASANSKYVNEEIEYFLKKHGASRILCALVQGEPPQCFPSALRALNEEPLAADFRPGKEFELSKLKLVAALAGVGFTELRNREAQRRKRQQLIAASLLAGIALGGLAYWDLFHREHVDYYVNYVRLHGIWEGVDSISAERASHRGLSFRFTRHGRLSPPERVAPVNGSGGCAEGLRNILGDEHLVEFVPLPDPFCGAVFSYARGGGIQRETLVNRMDVAKEELSYTADDIAQLTHGGFDAPSKGGGIRFVQFTRDADGRDIAVRFLYSRDVPRPNQRHEYGFAFHYDGQGRLASSSVLDNQSKEAGTVTRYVYAGDGALIEERSEDERGALRTNQFGYASKRIDNDVYGNPLKEHYHSIDSQPVNSASGYASITASYDERGNRVGLCYLDPAGAPAFDENGSPCRRIQHDGQGRQTLLASMTADGKRVTNAGGFSAIVVRYAPDGRSIDVRFLDPGDRPTEGQEGIAGVHIDYDTRGNSINRDFFDENGKPVLTTVGAHVRMKFDERDNRTDFLMLDMEGKPYAPTGGSGFAQRLTSFDERGNLVEVRFLDANLKPVVTREGPAIVRYAYDEFGNQVEERVLDPQGQLRRDENGVALYKAKFDRLGRKIENTYFDEKEQPTRQRKGHFGYRAEFDHLDRRTEVRYLDAHGAVMKVPELGVAGARDAYDRYGRVTERTYLGVDGNPVRDAPVARVSYEYDPYGNELARRHYDAAGALAVLPVTGCAVQKSEYDQYNNVSVERCLDPQEKPANRKEGWATKRLTREHGRVTGEDHFDAAGRPVKPKT